MVELVAVRARALVAAMAVALVAGCGLVPEVDRDTGSAVYYYEVRPGDTLYGIAWRHGLDPNALARWNALDDPDRLAAGQRIRLNPPDGRPQPPAPPARRQERAAVDPAPDPEPPAPGRARPDDSEIAWGWPADGELVRPFEPEANGKRGIEIGGERGAPVRAAADGRVVYSGSGLRGYGNLLIVKHNDRYLTAYGYNDELLVEEGAEVRRGQAIARMGRSTGAERASVHFELRRDGDPVDPRAYLP